MKINDVKRVINDCISQGKNSLLARWIGAKLRLDDDLISAKAKKRIVLSVVSGHITLLFLPLLLMLIAGWDEVKQERFIQVEMLPADVVVANNSSSPPPKASVKTPKPPKPSPKPPVKPPVKPPKPPPKASVKPPKPTKTSPKPPEKSNQNVVTNDSSPVENRTNNNPLINTTAPNNSSNLDQATVASYQSLLGGYFYSRWDTPEKRQLADISAKVDVEVKIASNGKIIRYRILSWSKEEYLNNSVRNLLRQIVSVPAPPGGKEFETVLRFNIAE